MTDISKIKSDRIDDGIKPGDICYSLRTEKTGWLLCNGQAVSRTDYSDLFAVIGTIFGSGDGNTTFNIPNCSGKFLQMISDGQSLGQELEAGLPNITGTDRSIASGIWGMSGSLYGATNANGTGATYGGTSSSTSYYRTTFDASRSSSIYGKSNTVQPPAIIVNYFIKY